MRDLWCRHSPDRRWVRPMASAGIRKNRNGTRYQVWWRLDDGSQGSKTFDSRALARDFKNELLAQAAANAWVDPRRGRLLFDDWADHWWRLWSASPRRSPSSSPLRSPVPTWMRKWSR